MQHKYKKEISENRFTYYENKKCIVIHYENTRQLQ